MARFENKTFTDEKIIVDDNEYMKCQFVNCTFVYGGGNYSIIDCNFSNSPESPFLELRHSADRTVHFLSVIHKYESARNREFICSNSRKRFCRKRHYSVMPPS